MSHGRSRRLAKSSGEATLEDDSDDDDNVNDMCHVRGFGTATKTSRGSSLRNLIIIILLEVIWVILAGLIQYV